MRIQYKFHTYLKHGFLHICIYAPHSTFLDDSFRVNTLGFSTGVDRLYNNWGGRAHLLTGVGTFSSQMVHFILRVHTEICRIFSNFPHFEELAFPQPPFITNIQNHPSTNLVQFRSIFPWKNFMFHLHHFFNDNFCKAFREQMCKSFYLDTKKECTGLIFNFLFWDNTEHFYRNIPIVQMLDTLYKS